MYGVHSAPWNPRVLSGCVGCRPLCKIPCWLLHRHHSCGTLGDNPPPHTHTKMPCRLTWNMLLETQQFVRNRFICIQTLHLQRIMTNTELNNRECGMGRSVSRFGNASFGIQTGAVKGWRLWYVWGGIDCLASALNAPIICKASRPLSVVDLIAQKIIL